MNHNFRVKSTVQLLYHYLYMPANFQAGHSITGVGRMVTNLRFWPILYVKEPCMKWGRARSGGNLLMTELAWRVCRFPSCIVASPPLIGPRWHPFEASYF